MPKYEVMISNIWTSKGKALMGEEIEIDADEAKSYGDAVKAKAKPAKSKATKAKS